MKSRSAREVPSRTEPPSAGSLAAREEIPLDSAPAARFPFGMPAPHCVFSPCLPAGRWMPSNHYMEVDMRRITHYIGALLLGCALHSGAAEAVDINAAGAAELATALDGVGQSKAEAIVEYREANGPFKSVDDLALVKGIGAATIEKNRDKVTISAPAR
jgi:competence protein ComEA